MKPILLIALCLFAIALVGVSVWLWTPDKSRTELEAKYLASPGDMRDVAGLRVHVRDSGPKDAPALVLLHGFASSLHTWEAWAKLLEADHRIVRLDLPGSGLTGLDPNGDYSQRRMIEIVLAVMDQLGLKRATIVGNSMGGRVAWAFAAEYPERVEKLVLISPDGFASPGRDYGQKFEAPAMLRIMTRVLPKVFVRPQLASAYGDPKRLTDATFGRYYDLMLAPGIRSAMITAMEQTVISDPRPALAGIRAPTLLLWGERDALIPFSNAADYLKALPNARLVSFPALGHVPFEEAPEESIEPLKTFLAE